jgi:hypothetical protein
MEDDNFFKLRERLKEILTEFYRECEKQQIDPENEIDGLLIEIEDY